MRHFIILIITLAIAPIAHADVLRISCGAGDIIFLDTDTSKLSNVQFSFKSKNNGIYEFNSPKGDITIDTQSSSVLLNKKQVPCTPQLLPSVQRLDTFALSCSDKTSGIAFFEADHTTHDGYLEQNELLIVQNTNASVFSLSSMQMVVPKVDDLEMNCKLANTSPDVSSQVTDHRKTALRTIEKLIVEYDIKSNELDARILLRLMSPTFKEQ